MIGLSNTDTLIIHQKKEWGELLLGVEGANKYSVCDGSGKELYCAVERGGCFPLRWFLKASRPFVMRVLDMAGNTLLTFERPFFCLFSKLYVYDDNGTYLGMVQRRFALFSRCYSVYDCSGREFCQIVSPFFHPWTFNIQRQGQEWGKITKEWSGLLTELFTDADSFGATFPIDWHDDIKSILLGAVFLIDFVHFEDRRQRKQKERDRD